MLTRCQIDPRGGEGEVDSRVGSGGSVPKKPLTTQDLFPACSEPPKRGQKTGAPRKLSKSVENILTLFDDF